MPRIPSPRFLALAGAVVTAGGLLSVAPAAQAATMLADPPKSLKARASSDAVSLQWTPPASMGDTPVIGYTVTVSDGRTVAVTGRDALISQPTAKAVIRVVDGLKPGTKYTFTIAAVTGTGAGASASVSATTPAG